MFRNLIRHSAVYSTVPIFSRVAAVFMVPLYTRYFSTAEYGLMELLTTTSLFLSSLVGARFSDALTNTYFNEGSERARRTVVSTGVLGMCLFGLAMLGAAFRFGPALSKLVLGTPEYATYFRYTFAGFALGLPAEAAYAYLRALNRSGLFAGLQVLYTSVLLMLTVWFLVGMRWGIIAMLRATVLAAALQFVILIWFVLAHCGFRFDMGVFRRQLRFSLPLVLGPAGMIFIHYGDRIFLERSVSLEVIGIYSLAYRLGMLVTYMFTPVLSYWRSQMYDIMKSGGELLYARLSTYIVLSLATMGLLISIFARPAIMLLTGSAFHGAAVYVPLITLGYVVLNASEFFRSVLLLANRPGREGWVMFSGTVFCMAAYATLIPRFGPWGAAAATTATFTMMLGYGFRQAQKVQRFRFENGRIARAAVSALGVYFVYALLPQGGFWMEAAKACGGSAAYLAVLLAGGFFHREELEQAMAFARQVSGRLAAAAAS